MPTSLESATSQGVTTESPLATIADDSQNLALEVVKFQSSQDRDTGVLPRPNPGAPLPRPKRRPRRAKSDRGLPPDEELANLTRVYLDRQRRHWPEMVLAGLLPQPTDKVIRGMVEDFKKRHRGGKVEVAAVRGFAKFCSKFGGNYNRFSCDNSSPLSIIDQMVNALDKSRSETRFIPWAYVYSDYSVTGLDSFRQGYTSYKALLADKDHAIETTYIDEFSRASRDSLEWWKLAALSKRLRKRLIGASDGFDLDSESAEMQIGFYGLFSQLFIKQLREKVRRGMKGAARRGTCLGKLGLGFTRQICRDANGAIISRPDGLPRHKPCVDPATKPYRVEMFELFVQKNWSPCKIARRFNQLRVDGSNGWTGSSVKKLLAGIDAIGIFVWNRQRREYDYDQEKIRHHREPAVRVGNLQGPELGAGAQGTMASRLAQASEDEEGAPSDREEVEPQPRIGHYALQRDAVLRALQRRVAA